MVCDVVTVVVECGHFGPDPVRARIDIDGIDGLVLERDLMMVVEMMCS